MATNDNSPETESPQPGPSQMGAGQTLTERRQELEQERARLLSEIEIKKLEKQVQVLRQQAEGTEPTAINLDDGSTPSESQHGASGRKRTRNDDDEHEPRQRRRYDLPGRPKVEKPDKYDGGGLRKLKEYIRKCETAFKLEPETYYNDAVKTLYAGQFLYGETLGAWLRLEESREGEVISWNEFKKLLRDHLQDPVTRVAAQAQRYNEAVQKPGQSVKKFVTFLDEMEAELPPYSDEHRRQHLLAKLRPELRRAINNYQDVPTTRAGLVNLAIQLEANNKLNPYTEETKKNRMGDTSETQARKEQANGKPNKFKPKGKSHEGSHNSTSKSKIPDTLTKEEREKRVQEKLCFKCGKPGHMARFCRGKASSTPSEPSKNGESQ
jgi:hypothetical protein